MTLLKTALAAGALAAATLAGAATSANAAVVVRHHDHGRVVTERFVHRAPVRIAVRAPIVRRPVAVWGGWYADPYLYRPYAYYRANPHLRACFMVTQPGFYGHRHAAFAATLCYGRNGAPYVVAGSRHFVRFM